MEAKKFLEKIEEKADVGKYIIQKYHVLDVDIDEDLITDVCDYWDDTAEAYEHGIVYNGENELVYIEVDDFITAIEERIDEDEEEDEEPDEQFVELLPKLQKYKGYTIWF